MPRSILRKPYTIAMVGDNEAEINLYGEVVRAHPIDWWTGNPVEGDYIAMDELLRDLDELKTKDHITVHINSVGGDFYCGLAIYNRLRTLPASITTINDGLAASAGSIIFMAGDKGKRKVHAGSNLMVHGVLAFFYGYYNAVELKAEMKTLEAHNKAAIAAYVEATGLSEETVKAAMSKDTYMVGQEAVDNGWADEVISNEEPVSMKLSPDKTRLMVNGYSVAARWFGKLPDTVQQMSVEEWDNLRNTDTGTSMQPAPQADINPTTNGGNHMAEIKNMEDLRAAHSDLVDQIENAAKASARNEGIEAERARIQGIEAIEAAIGDKALVQQAKYGENPMTAEQLALKAMQAQAAIGATVLNNLETDANGSGAAGVTATAAGGNPEGDPESPEAIMAQAKKDVAAFNKMKEVR